MTSATTRLSSIQVDSARLDSAGSVDASTAARSTARARRDETAASEGWPAGELAGPRMSVSARAGDILGSRPFLSTLRILPSVPVR